jgi:N-acetylglucosaminyl-diphospho-decaprenol L-rhamnosyltransferase
VALYISIVSHEHTSDIIDDLQPHRLQREDVRVIILANLPDQTLADYCSEHQIAYLQNTSPKGFGANHNQVFRHCRDNLGMEQQDWFLVLNPDVIVSPAVIEELITTLSDYWPRLAAANLFKDDKFKVFEGSIRTFPYIWDSFTSLVFKSKRTAVQRKDIKSPCHVDWASGAFLIFKAELYEALGGFDERYFLYYEDVDICWRALKLCGVRVLYLPNIKAVHQGKRHSHTAINQHMFWHISSAFRFSWIRLKTKLLGTKTLRRKRL